MREALWYEKLGKEKVRCLLCPHRCRLAPGRKGICGVRENQGGKLFTSNYGWCGAYAFDPVEKKPLYHFFPGKTILSVGTKGCNFRCEFCQNWELSQGDPDLFPLVPEALVKTLADRKDPRCVGVAYTYSEPIVWYEFVQTSARLVAEAGFKNVLVTNGFVADKPWEELLPFIDALNIDVKGFNPHFYRKVVHGEYLPVLKSAEKAKKMGCHVEITNLLIPGLNDKEEEIQALVDWIATSLGPEVPLHFSRYFPQYKLNLPPTPLATLKKAKEIAASKLFYVYLGNVPSEENTFCPQCRELLIRRRGWEVAVVGLRGNCCVRCGRPAEIIQN